MNNNDFLHCGRMFTKYHNTVIVEFPILPSEYVKSTLVARAAGATVLVFKNRKKMSNLRVICFSGISYDALTALLDQCGNFKNFPLVLQYLNTLDSQQKTILLSPDKLIAAEFCHTLSLVTPKAQVCLKKVE